MEHLNRMLNRTNEIKEATVSANADTSIERYVIILNSLIMDKSHALVTYGPVWSNALFECSVLSESSYFLVVHGYYDEASALLRMMLEGFLTRMYWHIRHKKGEVEEFIEDDKWINIYAKWELGLTSQYPSLRIVWETVLQEPVFDAYNQRYNLKAEVEASLKILDKFVHGRPNTRHRDGGVRSSSLNLWFNQERFDEWFDNLRIVIASIIVISFLEYPELLETRTAVEFASLEPKHDSRVRSFLQVPSLTQ